MRRTDVGAVCFDDEEVELACGATARLRLGALALRAEFEKLDTDVIGDPDVIPPGVTFTFGSSRQRLSGPWPR